MVQRLRTPAECVSWTGGVEPGVSAGGGGGGGETVPLCMMLHTHPTMRCVCDKQWRRKYSVPLLKYTYVSTIRKIYVKY